MKAYGGYITDNDILKQCASGGLATVMYENIIKDGGICYGAVYTNGFKSAEYVRCDKLSETGKFRSSKYIKVNLSEDTKKQIASELETMVKGVQAALDFLATL